jgi:hypothetical protein
METDTLVPLAFESKYNLKFLKSFEMNYDEIINKRALFPQVTSKT